MNGIIFGNYHSWNDFSLILSQKTIGTPSPKVDVIDIPCGDGVLDLSEFFGEVKYNNRQLSFEFTSFVPQRNFMEQFTMIQDALHGQRMQIILDDDPAWYYVGRITVSEWKAEKSIGKLTIDCDCEPYKYMIRETVVKKTVSTSETITLYNSRKRAVPTITTDSETTISFGNYTGTLSAGTYTIADLMLTEGKNTVTVSGSGNITFRYREGAL